MPSPQDSIDTEQPPRDSSPHGVKEEFSPPCSGQLHEIAHDQLEAALGTDTASEKNYHIREALQALVIAAENPE